MKEEQNQVIIKIVKQFGHFLDRFIIMLVTMIVLVGIYALWDSYQIYQSASAEQYEIYRPSENNSVSFEEIQKVNPDVFGLQSMALGLIIRLYMEKITSNILIRTHRKSILFLGLSLWIIEISLIFKIHLVSYTGITWHIMRCLVILTSLKKKIF